MNSTQIPVDGEISRELSDGLCRVSAMIRWGVIRQHQLNGLATEEIAKHPPRASVSNIAKCERGIANMLAGVLPTTAAKAEKTARAYKCLRDYGSLTPHALQHVNACLAQLHVVNPNIKIHEQYQPGVMRDV